jgi:hypothetical protein
MRGCRSGGAAHGHRRRRRNRRSVAASDHSLGRLEAGEGHHLLDVGGPVEAHDRGLAEYGFDAPQRTDGVVTDGRPRSRADVGRQPNPLTDRERGRRLLLGAGRTPWLRAWRGPDNCHWSHDSDLFVLFIVVVVLIVVVIHDDLDILDRVRFNHVVGNLGVDDVRVSHLVEGGRLLRFLHGRGCLYAVVGCASGHI